MPDNETLERCFWTNPDGAGFMYADGKRVRIRKGFMTFESFTDSLNAELDGLDTTETAVVMHFRIATHGKVKPEICHPFPISSEPDELRKTRTESRFAVAHNGVISGRFTNDNWSDTMDFVADVMTPLMRMNPSFMHSSDAIDLLEGACDSKLAIMDNSGDIALVGSFIEDEGVFYSNAAYLRTVHSYSGYGSLFSGSTYYEAYPDYDDWEDIERLVEQLPFEACRECVMAEECALNYQECDNELMAASARDYYNGIEEMERLELTV